MSARGIYGKAQQTSAISQTVLAEYAMPAAKVGLAATGDEVVLEIEGIPEWASLFGSLELCECTHCRSVLSPAAYLVDLLYFLSARPARIKGKHAKDALFLRRPDLGDIELTCDNTNTPLPYVDLVLEVLEDAIAPFPTFVPFSLPADVEGDLTSRTLSDTLKGKFAPPLSDDAVITAGGDEQPAGDAWWTIDDSSCTYTIREENGQLVVVARSRQTKGSAAERAATPQYRNGGAYEVLGEAVYPWSLPFAIGAAEAATYLAHLGVPRAAVMEALLPGARVDVLENVGLAREALGLSTAEALIVVGSTTGQPGSATPGLWNLWGFGDETLSPENALPDPADSNRRLASGHWLDLLRRVDVFLQQAGLKYRELLNLLDTFYVNPVVDDGRAIHIVSSDPQDPDTCETAKLTLEGLDIAAAARAVRFGRLWRRIGWSMRDLDRALTAFASADLDDSSLTKLAHVARLHEALNVSALELISWWAPIDTAGYVDHDASDQPRAASLYDWLFRNRAVLNPPDSAFVEDAQQLKGTLSGHAATIATALRIDAAEFVALLEDENVVPRDPTDPSKPDDKLTLDHLSRLHRHASLARALRLELRDYLTLLELIGPDPFATTTDTILFVESAGLVRESGFDAPELAYLLRHAESSPRPFSPTESSISELLGALRAGVQQIAADNTFRDDPDDPAGPTIDLNGDLTRQKLALLNWDAARVELAVATLAGALACEAPLAALPDGLELPNAPPVYGVPLAALPGGFTFPPELSDAVAFDPAEQRLVSMRVLTMAERTVLTEAATSSGDAALAAATASLLAEQDALRGEIRHDAERGALRFFGPMTNARRARLDGASGADADFHTAVGQLYDAPRRYVGRYMRTFSVPDHSVEFVNPPPSAFPPKLKAKVYFDATSEPHRLHFLGPMSEEERDALIKLAPDPGDPAQAAYLAAVQQLYDQAKLVVPAVGDAFLTADGPENDAAALFDDAVDPGDRFLYVLQRLLPHLLRVLGERLAGQTVAEALDLEPRTADALLRTWMRSPVDPSRHCLDDLLDPSFVDSSANIAPSAKAFPNQHRAYLRVHKTALLVRRLSLTFRALGWLFTVGPGFGWIDPNTLPLDADGVPASFEEWARLVELARLRPGWPRGEEGLEALLKSAAGIPDDALATEKDDAKGAWCAALLERTEWSADDLAALVGSADDHTSGGQLKVAFPTDFVGVQLLLRLRDVMGVLRRMGVAAGDGVALCGADVSAIQGGRLRQAVRAKYDEAQWLTLAKPISDAVRERQRAALVAYLIAHLRRPLTVLEWPHPELAFQPNQPIAGAAVRELQRKLNAAGATPALGVDGVFAAKTHAAVKAFQDENALPDTGKVDAATWAVLDEVRLGIHDAHDLYAYILIDVEMDPCTMTSRIKQAIGSVQLFVQRCLMGLEADVAAGIDVDFHWRQWKWMKNYRVWEANRKVFLYPENWIEPELRDDKSPFFLELESELLQNEPTDETAERAFVHYLESLDQVSHLEVVALHHQLEDDGSGNLSLDILHVFARTPSGSPRTYFYRRRVDDIWTAWERVDLDIAGEHLIPIVWNRRLYLFWPTFTLKPEETSVSTDGTSFNIDTPKNWEIKLTWSQRYQGGWAGARVSTETITVPESWLATEADVFFRVEIDESNALKIALLGSKWFIGDTAWFTEGDYEGGVSKTYAFVLDGYHSEPEPRDVFVATLTFELVTGTTFDRMYQAELGSTMLFLPAPADTAALASTPGDFRLLPHANGVSIAKHATFYQDNWRAYFVAPFDKRVPWDPAKPADPGDLLIDPGVSMEYQPIDPGGPVIDASDPALFESSYATAEAKT